MSRYTREDDRRRLKRMREDIRRRDLANSIVSPNEIDYDEYTAAWEGLRAREIIEEGLDK